MSLEFFREKRFQRRHPDVFCQRMALTIPCVSSLRVTPHQVLQSFHCSSSTSLARPGERISLSNPLALPVVKGSQRLCRRPPGFQTCSRSRANEDVERFSFHKGHQHCVQLICQHSQSVQRHHNFCCCVRFCHCCRFSFHGPTSRHLSLQGAHSRRSSLYVVPKIRTHSPCASTVWIDSRWTCCGQHCCSHCLRKGLWQV